MLWLLLQNGLMCEGRKCSTIFWPMCNRVDGYYNSIGLMLSGTVAKYAKYAYLGAYLGAPNKVKWGVPEKILQNAVQTRCS